MPTQGAGGRRREIFGGLLLRCFSAEPCASEQLPGNVPLGVPLARCMSVYITRFPMGVPADGRVEREVLDVSRAAGDVHETMSSSGCGKVAFASDLPLLMLIVVALPFVTFIHCEKSLPRVVDVSMASR